MATLVTGNRGYQVREHLCVVSLIRKSITSVASQVLPIRKPDQLAPTDGTRPLSFHRSAPQNTRRHGFAGAGGGGV